MKQQIFVIIGAVIILLLVFVWIYLLFFGTPKNIQETITNIGGVGNNTTQVDKNGIEIEDTNDEEGEPVINTDRPNLRQLTTKPVAGFREINEPITDELPTIFYVEMGTGHIYSIDLENGDEKRVSATTVAGTNVADISPTGEYAVFGKRNNTKYFPVVIGEIGTSTDTDIIELTSTADQFYISDENELLYTTKNLSRLAGHSYDLETNTNRLLFELPFYEATIQWGEDANDTHYAYPNPSSQLEGYLYQINSGNTTRLHAAGFGLSALANDDIIAFNVAEEQIYKGHILNRETNEKTQASWVMMPEKCTISKTTPVLICAEDDEAQLSPNFPDDWYQGEVSFKDSLWVISGDDLSARLLVDTFEESGREIDVINMSIGNSTKAVYFINKNDNTLWMYEL